MNNSLTSAGCSAASPTPRWIDLPKDVTANILRRLGPAEIIASAEKVCTTWRRVCAEPSLWRVLDVKNYQPHQLYRPYDNLSRLAVDRSQGELIDINIEYFGTDYLLGYISDRSSNLRRLRIKLCEYISINGLTTAVEKFPLLEELHIFSMPSICFMDIESIGISCPMLKSFIMNNRGSKHQYKSTDDDNARSIAKNMPNLCHLSLVGSKLSNAGLEAILNGCTNLESLDLRECFNVDLQSDVGRSCLEKIKEFRRPSDPTSDNESAEDCYSSGDGDGKFDDYYDYYDYYDYCDDY